MSSSYFFEEANEYFPNTCQLSDLCFENELYMNINNNNLTPLNDIFNEPNKSNINELANDYLIDQYNPFNQKTLNMPEIKQIIINNKKLLGRKTKNTDETGDHDKYAEDNMTKKIKVIIKKDLLNFINKKIKESLNLSNIIINDKTYEKDEIRLLKPKHDQIRDNTIDGIKRILDSKIRDFFSFEISNKYQKYPSNFNALLIEKIYQIENAESVTSILDKTFLECLKYYRKDEDIINNNKFVCLNGLEKSFEGLKDKLMKIHDEKYADKLIKLIKEFEIVYSNKKSRAKRVKNLK